MAVTFITISAYSNTKSSQGCSINGRCLKQKKRPKKEPSAGSIVSHPPCPPLPPPELPLPSRTVSSLSMSAESATTAKGTSSSQLITVPLDLLPHHIQQNLLDSQAVLFQLMVSSTCNYAASLPLTITFVSPSETQFCYS